MHVRVLEEGGWGGGIRHMYDDRAYMQVWYDMLQKKANAKFYDTNLLYYKIIYVYVLMFIVTTQHPCKYDVIWYTNKANTKF